MHALIDLHQRIWQSFRRLPLWVQLWLAIILIPVNLFSLLLLEHASGQLIAVAALLVLGSNTVLLYLQGGFSRLMALPHLLVWGPLQIFLLVYLMDAAADTREFVYLCVLLAVNGISLAFDLLDSWRWFQGGREVF
jgi:hypothetical protein